jgi:23S rRNA pseudouridine1911/1915/1917 synthase
MTPPLTVLFEDNHCLAVAKPAGWLTMGDRTGDETLLERAKAYIKERYQKPGAVYLGVVHRLDRPVSGVVLFARTSKAAGRLSAQFREHQIEKVYWAWVDSPAVPEQGVLQHALAKDAERNLTRVVAGSAAAGRESALAYRRLEVAAGRSLLEVRPETGRSHQIRVQLAAAGWPIAGDAKYGSRTRWSHGAIGLHAQSLTFLHPVSSQPITVVCAVPTMWSKVTSAHTAGTSVTPTAQKPSRRPPASRRRPRQ